MLQPSDLIDTKGVRRNMPKLSVREILYRNIQTLDSLPGLPHSTVMTCLALRRLRSVVVTSSMWLIRCKEGLVLEAVMLFIGRTHSFVMVLIVRDFVSQ